MNYYDTNDTEHTLFYRWQAIGVSTTSMMWSILLDKVFQAQSTEIDVLRELLWSDSSILLLFPLIISFNSDLRLFQSDTKNSAKRFQRV